MADIEGHGILAAGSMLGHGPPRVGQGHLPSAEGNHLGAQRHVGLVQRGHPDGPRHVVLVLGGGHRSRLGGGREGQIQTVGGQQGQEVTLIHHGHRDLGIKLAHAPNLAVLAGDQPLVGRSQFDEETPVG
jgi:hypothetical protein